MIPKFRAWDKESKTMDTVRRITWTDGDIADVYLENIGLRRLDQVILMQSTGLKDKYGVEIYEGDVIRDIDFIGRYDGDAYEVVYNLDIHHPALMNTISGYETNDEVEVLGNFYENPELLEVSK